MKVIQEPDHTWGHQFVCRECQAGLEAEADDILIRRFEGEVTFYVACPFCDTPTTLDNSKLPILVRQRAITNNAPAD